MKIGFIGIGYMGHGMAKNILEKGYSLKFIANVKRKAADNLISRGAIEETRIQDLCRDIDVLQLCLSSSDQVEDILINKRAINFLKKDSVIIDSTTANPVSSENIIKICTENNINFIDAPLGKTPKEAWDGSLDAIVGAKNDVLEKFKPIIDCWAGRIVHVGDPGSGHKLKLLNNMLSLSYYSLYYEVLTICKQSKISEETFHSVISGSRMDNELFQSFMKYVLDPRKEIDCAEIYVPFSWYEPMWLENLLLADIGKGWMMSENGDTSLEGSFPVNMSGGVLSSNPIGASGLIRFGEAAQQVRQKAGDYQVSNANIALGHAFGGGAQFFAMWIVASKKP